MSGMIAERKEAMAHQKQLDAQAPKTGDPAPDFELSDLDGQNPVRLSDFWGQKPVELLCGLGPFGFKPAELEAAIKAYLASTKEGPA
jgi:hypothetical protein